jgi:hypothetical protein
LEETGGAVGSDAVAAVREGAGFGGDLLWPCGPAESHRLILKSKPSQENPEQLGPVHRFLDSRAPSICESPGYKSRPTLCGFVRTDKPARITVYFSKFSKFITNSGKNTKKTRENCNKSGENFISNFDRLIHLILNFVKYVQIGPITVYKFEFLKNNKKIRKNM